MKKGQFFSIDVFVAIAIIAVGLFVLYTSKSIQPSTAQTSALSTDLMGSFNSLKVYEVDNPYVIELIQNGNITRTDNTLLQQISEFYIDGKPDLAGNVTEKVTAGVLPLQYAFSLYLDGTSIYESRPFDVNSPNVIATKRLVAGVKNSTLFWGPILAEVRVWR